MTVEVLCSVHLISCTSSWVYTSALYNKFSQTTIHLTLSKRDAMWYGEVDIMENPIQSRSDSF